MLNHIKGIAIHLIIMVGLFAGGLYYLFYSYLPSTTNHGETLTVPDLEGLSIAEVSKKLENNSLKYIIIDSSTFNPRYEPSVVMNQEPSFNSKVKENRKIYLTINAATIPSVSIPDLSNKSLRNAIIILEGSGLKKDSVIYKPYSSPVVIGYYYKGKKMSAGDSVPKGSSIGLVVGLTEGNTDIRIPDLIGKSYQGLKAYLEGYGLILSTRWVKDEELPQNIVFKQKPMPSDSTETRIKTVKAGSIIDVWITGEEPKDSIL